MPLNKETKPNTCTYINAPKYVPLKIKIMGILQGLNTIAGK